MMFISSYYPTYLTNAYRENPNFDEKTMNSAEWYLITEVLPQIIQACRKGEDNIVLYRKDFPTEDMENELCRILLYRGFHTIGTFNSVKVVWY